MTIHPLTRRDRIAARDERWLQVYDAVRDAGQDLHAGEVHTRCSPDFSIHDAERIMAELEAAGHLREAHGFGYYAHKPADENVGVRLEK